MTNYPFVMFLGIDCYYLYIIKNIYANENIKEKMNIGNIVDY